MTDAWAGKQVPGLVLGLEVVPATIRAGDAADYRVLFENTGREPMSLLLATNLDRTPRATLVLERLDADEPPRTIVLFSPPPRFTSSPTQERVTIAPGEAHVLSGTLTLFQKPGYFRLVARFGGAEFDFHAESEAVTVVVEG